MAEGVVHFPWYPTVFRSETFPADLARVAPLALRYGATKYNLQRSLDDRYKLVHMIWFDSKQDWYRYWESREMIEFRARNMGKYQIPIVYVWHEELASGELGPTVENGNGHTPEPAPALEPEHAG
jgi:hypothetical protein